MGAQNVGTSSVVLHETRDFTVFVLSDSYFDRRSIGLHMGDSDVIYSYQLFPRHFMGQALRNVCYSDVSRRRFLNRDSTDIFLN